MATLIETRVTRVYRTRCPHCRTSTVEHTREGTVTVVLDGKGEIVDVTIGCDWAQERGQDRT